MHSFARNVTRPEIARTGADEKTFSLLFLIHD